MTKMEYCTVCGKSGELLVCDSRDCPNVFCKDCVITFDSEKAYNEILKKSPWNCHVCTGEHLGILKCCGDWQERLLKIFNSSNISDEVELTLIPEKRYPIRVLSLFDGIGTGKVILDQLGLETEVYYCSEIDAEATLVTKVNHPEKVVYLGDVRSINLKTVRRRCFYFFILILSI
ncbi:unnamed protein product [Soboliphyme baturini]|uniref:PHD-type domain-containing protein n=1 Tax=Soboliphyme baturini TaxID=241478 RepID=A0A183J6S5_9BILA|nr:unnamed protein product [Soboliphyme baturini]